MRCVRVLIPADPSQEDPDGMKILSTVMVHELPQPDFARLVDSLGEGEVSESFLRRTRTCAAVSSPEGSSRETG
jgi:hypothetical protein